MPGASGTATESFPLRAVISTVQSRVALEKGERTGTAGVASRSRAMAASTSPMVKVPMEAEALVDSARERAMVKKLLDVV